MCSCSKIEVRLRRAGTHGKGMKAGQVVFFKVTALFLYFLCSKSFGRLFISFFFINKKVFSMEQKVFLCLL